MPATLPTHKVLIVDDNTTNLKVAVNHLSDQNLELLTARNGEDGLKRAQLARPDLVLLDVRMPGLNGFEVCRLLKADEKTADIPVIFLTALADPDDKVEGFEAGGVDYITKPIEPSELIARVKNHLALSDLRRGLEERVHELDSFARTVAHDLKNPLSRIITGLELLEQMAGPQLDGQVLEVLQISVSGGRQMLNIVDGLLLLANVRQGDVVVEPIDSSAIVHKVLESQGMRIEELQAKIVVNNEQWPTALGYPIWVEEVWTNYITNALKYGGRPPEVMISASQQDDGFIRFWIRDNGQGIAEEDQERLFTEFTRLYHPDIRGHGLGLSIVKRIVQRLGGEVGVISKVGQGSEFYFTLPAAN